MKTSAYYIAILAFMLAFNPVIAQSPTASPSAEVEDTVDQIKEKIAEKVESLNKKERATSGKITLIDKTGWDIEDSDGNKERISIDETLTDFYEISSTAIKEVKQSVFAKGDFVFVEGPKIGDSVTANAVYKDTLYMVFSGKVTQVDSAEFMINVLTLDKTNYEIDIESKTDQKMLNIKTLKLDKIGFSKLKEGDSVHVVVKADLKDPKKTRFSATRLLVVPNEYFMQ